MSDNEEDVYTVEKILARKFENNQVSVRKEKQNSIMVNFLKNNFILDLLSDQMAGIQKFHMGGSG